MTRYFLHRSGKKKKQRYDFINAAWKSTVAAAAHIRATRFRMALRLALAVAVAADEGPVTDTEEKHFISAPPLTNAEQNHPGPASLKYYRKLAWIIGQKESSY